MKIVVCVKQVPETGQARWDQTSNTMIREGTPSIINPFDMYAVEEGLRIREKLGGEVVALSMGPPQVLDALREILALGADDAVLLTDRAFAGSDTLATSRTLAAGIAKLGSVDIIICGKQATDGDTAQVGPELAHHLDMPFIAYVRKIEEVRDGYLRAERMMEFGYEVVESPLPAVISVVKEINEPRLPSLKGKLRARKAEIKQWGVNDVDLDEEMTGLAGSPTQVIKIFTPPPRGEGEILEGDPEAMVDGLISRLRKRKLI